MINLLPPEIRSEYAAARRNTSLRHYLVLILILLVICIEISVYGYISLHAEQTNAQTAIATNQAQLDSLKKTSTEATNISGDINKVGQLLAKKISFADMVTGIGKNTPPGAFLTNLQLNVQDLGKQPVVLTFRVNSQNTAAVLRNNLSASNVFSQVTVQSVSKIETDSNDTSQINAKYPFEATLNAKLNTAQNGDTK